MTSIKYDAKKLEEVVKTLRDGYKVRVGILGGDGSEERADNLDMAGLGAVHEFGSITNNIPARSFLREPIENNLGWFVKEFGEEFAYYLEKKQLKKWYLHLAFFCEAMCKRAFKTSGDGKWAPNSPITVKLKGSSLPLIDTGDLSRSISSEVLNDSKRK